MEKQIGWVCDGLMAVEKYEAKKAKRKPEIELVISGLHGMCELWEQGDEKHELR